MLWPCRADDRLVDWCRPNELRRGSAMPNRSSCRLVGYLTRAKGIFTVVQCSSGGILTSVRPRRGNRVRACRLRIVERAATAARGRAARGTHMRGTWSEAE
jgi:hypothetical protein